MSGSSDPVDGRDAPSILSLVIQGGAGEPECVLMIGRPDGAGRVRVREWTSNDWQSAVVYDVTADEIMNRVERAVRAFRRVSEDPRSLRRWLGAADR
ncbi:MAG TPA: hypothetical protein VFG84_06040 [Gemmatimonadaceae bacterium]|nr:hypothetical protein [Gemmatimonadaceae bacterium]